MTIHARFPKRLRIYEEPAGSFAVDGSGTLANFIDCPFVWNSLSYELREDRVETEEMVQDLDDWNVEVALPKRAVASWQMNLQTLGSRVGDGSQAVQGALGRLLKIVMGGEHLGTGNAVSGGTAAAPQLDAVTGLEIGAAVGILNSSGRLEAREIKDITSTTLSLKHALSGEPSGEAYAAATYYLGGKSGDVTTSLQAVLEGYSPQERYGLFGGWCTGLTFEEITPLTPIPRLTFNWEFAHWAYADGTAMSADLDTGVITEATYANNTTHVVRDSEMRVQENGTTTIGDIIKARAVRFTPGITYAVERSPGGVNTVNQPLRVRGEKPTVEFDLSREDAKWFSHRSDEDMLGIWFQLGSSSTRGCVLLSFPTAQVVDIQELDIDGIYGQRVTCRLRNDRDTDRTGLSGADLDLARSTFRLHLL